MKHSGEELPFEPAPEGDGYGGRYESADLDIEALTHYFHTTVFENKAAIKELLSGKYFMPERKYIEAIEMNMTRIFDTTRLEALLRKVVAEHMGEITEEGAEKEVWNIIMKLRRGEKVFLGGEEILLEDAKITSKPLSGKDPEAVARITVKTTEEIRYDLRIFKVFNRNNEFRYEYILNPIERREEA